MALEIGEECVQSLGCLGDRSDSELEALARAVNSVLVDSQREDVALNSPVLEKMDVDLIKTAYSALVCLFVEAAKNNVSEKSVVMFLWSECGVPEPQGKLVAEVFESKKEALRRVMSRTGNWSSIPRLVGVDWRLEYRVLSSTEIQDHPPRELLYHCAMKTAEKQMVTLDGETDGKIDFVCSVEQLQDLVSTLKDACKAVERVVHQG
jgi:hypothetical protein